MQLNSAIFDCIYLRDTEVLFFKTDNYGQLGGHILRKFIFNECSWPITSSQFCNKVHKDLFKHTTEKALNIVKNHNVSNHRFFMYVQVNGNLNLPYVILHSDIYQIRVRVHLSFNCVHACLYAIHKLYVRTKYQNIIYAKSIRKDLVRMIGHSANCLKNKVIILPK